MQFNVAVATLLVGLISSGARSQDPEPPAGPDPSIAEYVAFLDNASAGPVDYVMGLFDDHDVVILCERDHRDASQYDLILELVSDQRFIDRVGRICTEVGTSSLRPYVREFLATPGLSEDSVEERLLHIYRNLTFFPLWEKYNFFDFLRRLYRLNETLQPGQRVSLYPSDMPFTWSGMTGESYRAFRKTLGQRDQVMANQVLETFREISAGDDQRKKLLVIMNYRHAFNDFEFADGRKGDNVGRYLFEALPGQVANVWINSFGLLPGTTDRNPVLAVVQDGRWDAAFEVAGNPSRGFDFAESPFGKDHFDLFPFRKHDVTYQDVFTGMVFYKPLREFRLVVNVPGLFDAEFLEEFKRREAITGRSRSEDELRRYVERFGKLKELSYPNLAEMQEAIDRWR